jgi:hypothetical protein
MASKFSLPNRVSRSNPRNMSLGAGTEGDSHRAKLKEFAEGIVLPEEDGWLGEECTIPFPQAVAWGALFFLDSQSVGVQTILVGVGFAGAHNRRESRPGCCSRVKTKRIDCPPFTIWLGRFGRLFHLRDTAGELGQSLVSTDRRAGMNELLKLQRAELVSQKLLNEERSRAWRRLSDRCAIAHETEIQR